MGGGRPQKIIQYALQANFSLALACNHCQSPLHHYVCTLAVRIRFHAKFKNEHAAFVVNMWFIFNLEKTTSLYYGYINLILYEGCVVLKKDTIST
jgi:hypothetical protein